MIQLPPPSVRLPLLNAQTSNTPASAPPADRRRWLADAFAGDTNIDRSNAQIAVDSVASSLHPALAIGAMVRDVRAVEQQVDPSGVNGLGRMQQAMAMLGCIPLAGGVLKAAGKIALRLAVQMRTGGKLANGTLSRIAGSTKQAANDLPLKKGGGGNGGNGPHDAANDPVFAQANAPKARMFNIRKADVIRLPKRRPKPPSAQIIALPKRPPLGPPKPPEL